MRRFLHRRHDSDLYVVHDVLARRVEKRVRLEPALFDLRVVFGVPWCTKKCLVMGNKLAFNPLKWTMTGVVCVSVLTTWVCARS